MTTLLSPRQIRSGVLNSEAQVASKCAEFLQGVDLEGTPVLVTATPSDGRFAVTAQVDGAESFAILRRGQPTNKSEEAVRRFAALKGLDLGLAPQITLQTSTPVGKGRASSSQDLAAVLLVIARWFEVQTTSRELYKVMCAVERSDYMFRPGRMIRADPVGGSVLDLARMPAMLGIVWDDEPNGVVFTDAVAHLDTQRRLNAARYEELVDQLTSGNVVDVMEVATVSASLNQNLLPKHSYDFARMLARQFGGGVMVAHTGTIIGVLIPPECERLTGAVATAREAGFSPVVHTFG